MAVFFSPSFFQLLIQLKHATLLLSRKALMAKLVRHLTSNEEIVGSNPAESNLRFFLHICLEYIYSGYIFFLSFFFIN